MLFAGNKYLLLKRITVWIGLLLVSYKENLALD